MNNYYPYNRLQIELKKREDRRVLKVFVFVSILIGLMMVPLSNKVFAAGTLANPSNVAGLIIGTQINYDALPSDLFTQGECQDTGKKCEDVIIYAGGGTNISNQKTCVATLLEEIGSDITFRTLAYVSDGTGKDEITTPITSPSTFYGVKAWDSGTSSWVGGGVCQVISAQNISEVVLSTSDLVNNGNFKDSGLDTGYGLGGSVGNNQVLVSANGFLTGYRTVELILQSIGPYVLGQNIDFRVDWQHQLFTVENIWFFEDVEETSYTVVTENFPMPDAGNGGNVIFKHAFNFGGTYHPRIVVANGDCSISSTGSIIGIGCLYEEGFVDSIIVVDQSTISNELDVLYSSIFTVSKTNDVIVGSPVTFTYDLSTNFCSTSSVSGKRLFLGFHEGLAYSDSGAVLVSGLSGTVNRLFPRTNQPYSDFFYPYIRVYCGDGTSKDVYLGGSLQLRRAQGISVYNQNDVRFALPAHWLNGGGNVSFASGTGTFFASDKGVYKIGEPVKLRWVFNDNDFVINKIELWSSTGGTLLHTFTGSINTEKNKNHYATISYAYEGEYQPYIRICSTNCESFRRYYLGGLLQPNPNNAIMVTKQASTLYTNTGAILGTFAGTGGRINANGVFQIPALNFDGFGPTGNWFLDQAQSLLLVVIWAAIYVAEKLWVLLQATALFSWLSEILHPAAGTQYVLPQTMFGFQMPTGLAGQNFTVTYVSGGNTSNVTKLVQIAFTIAVIFWVMRQFLFHRRKS